ncbi:hypothetical protein EVAR_103340_1 [Eumeta japonica]|uniref:Uncharacterized protein n=1 Tax=Eumeta variegata TaxID=151549 RepID=A0A4C1Z966_EUMVA|nr:hypothetical protein EVAR_103340_1 [Eumeta japonica]
MSLDGMIYATLAPLQATRLQGLRTPTTKYEGRIEAILRHRGITSMRSYARRLTINRRIPPIRRPRNLHRVRPDGTCECRRRVTCAMDDAWWKSSRHRMSQETVTGRFPSLLPGRRRLAAAGWSKGA